MRLFSWIGSSCLILVVLACSSDGIFGTSGHLDYSAATFACGPADGPATTIFLAAAPITSLAPQGSYVQLYMPVTLDEAATTKFWPISSNSELGAWAVTNPGDRELATSGYLLIDSVDVDKTVYGSVDLEFDKAGHLQSTLRATWRPSNVLCG